MKEILVLGAGRVAKPCVQYLLRNTPHHVTVVDIDDRNFETVTENHERSDAFAGDASKDAKGIIEKVKPDIVINLLPPHLMAPVAAICVESGVHYINPSYIKDDMLALAAAAREKGLLLLCELGLDPGIDHMSAAKTVREIHEKGGEVESFWSCCGALPALKDNTNPFGYKLSWAPESLIGASKRTARIMKDGKTVEMPDGETFRHPHMAHVEGLGWFEEYANADSLPYVGLYDMPEVKNVYRGTFRYVGWSETIAKMNELGLFEEEKTGLSGLTYRDFTAKLAGAKDGEDTEEALLRFLGREPFSSVALKLKWLGLLDDREIPFETGSPRDVAGSLYAEKLVYGENEQDLVVMEHRYVAHFPESGKRVMYKSTLIDHGRPGGETSIARTTGIPPAIGAALFLDGKISARGVQAPVLPEVYEPSLELLEQEGISFTERTEEL